MITGILLLLLSGTAQADQKGGETNENNIVYCSSCHAYINTSTGQKVPFPTDVATPATPAPAADAVIGR